jgi:hypothetical protein
MPSTLFPTRSLVLLSCVVALVGCATVDVVRVKDEDYVTKGLRYWLPAPYVIVKAPVEISSVQELAMVDAAGKVTILGVQPPTSCEDTSGLAKPAGSGNDQGVVSLPSLGEAPGQKKAPAVETAAPKPKPTNPQPAGEAPGANKTPAAENTATAPKSAASNDAIAIVWLPDYCQQYAINQSERGASTQLQLTFADGWQLTSYNAQMNSTEVFNKMVDALASVVGTAAKAAPKAAAAGMQAGASAVAKNTFAGNHPPKRLFLRTTTTVLEPGVYPLFTYEGDNCLKAPKFCSQKLKEALAMSVTWEEIAPNQKE